MEERNDEGQFERLFQRALGGTEQDRANLLESFRDYLRNIAAKALTSEIGGQLSASDLVQSAIIEANRDFETCQATNPDEFKVWIRRILINDMLNRFRALKRQKRDIRREQQMGSRLEVADEAADPVNELIQQEDERRLMSALSQLTDERRRVIEFRYRDGLSFVEIAEHFQISPDAVRMIWNRAIDSLSRIIGNQQDDA